MEYVRHVGVKIEIDTNKRGTEVELYPDDDESWADFAQRVAERIVSETDCG